MYTFCRSLIPIVLWLCLLVEIYNKAAVERPVFSRGSMSCATCEIFIPLVAFVMVQNLHVPCTPSFLKVLLPSMQTQHNFMVLRKDALISTLFSVPALN